MWLSDYKEAIEGMITAVGDSAWTEIAASWDGNIFVFNPGNDLDWRYVYFRNSGRVEKRFSDTWNNPEHKEVIVEGD